jgi:predicted nucleic acid-binding protein
MSVYIDTSALLAVLNQSDDFHDPATVVWNELLDSGTHLITSSFVAVELHALVQNRLGMEAVRTLTKDILPLFEMVWIDAELYQQAVTALLTANRQQLSLVDCVSFAVMHQFKIEKAFSFDSHFGEQGFEVLGLNLQ